MNPTGLDFIKSSEFLRFTKQFVIDSQSTVFERTLFRINSALDNHGLAAHHKKWFIWSCRMD